MSVTGIIADIERASTHDGPGIRTVVFMKGCPLSCAWCHNPECISRTPETLFYPEKCLHCGKCESGCYSGARVICGHEMTVDEVFCEVLRDRAFYGNDGGLTISGGEPLLQKEFTKRLSEMVRAAKIHTAVETSLCIFDEETLRSFDLIMFDLKAIDNEKHLAYTKASLSPILENIRKAASLGIPMIARTPVIIGVNDSDIPLISEFLSGIDAVKKYELLPYHPLGMSKSAALGRPQRKFEIPSKEKMEELSKYAFIR